MIRFLLLLTCSFWIFSLSSQDLELSGSYADSALAIPVSNSTGHDTFWAKLDVLNLTDEPVHYLEFGNLSSVTLYEDGRLIGTTGKLLPLSDQSYSSFRNLIPITEKGEYLLKFSDNHPLYQGQSIAPKLYTLSQLRRQENQRQIAQGLFFGLMIVMSLYNLMIYFSVRDRSYLYYVLSIVGLGLYLFFFYGFSIELLWPNAPRWDVHFFALVIPLTNISRILFTKSYLHTWEYVPKWHRFFNVLMWLYSIPLLLWLLSYAGGINVLSGANQFIGLFGTAVMLSITVVSVLVYRKGYTPALWFLVAYVLFNIGGILFIFRELGYLPDNFFTRYFMQFGAAAQVILFSLGLADRLNRTREKLAEEILEKERIAREREIEKNKKVEIKNEELERLVKNRTQELESVLDKITRSETELRELNQIKDRLFSIISHDLKNPLTTVDSFLNLLIQHYDKLSKEDLQELSNKTKFALQNLIILLDNLLQWSRMQQNYLSFQPESVDVDAAVSKTIRLFHLLLEEKEIDIQLHNPDPEMQAWGDKNMFEFVLRNLIHNALKFTTKKGSITIDIRKEGEFVAIIVTDSGVGMKQTEIDRILTLGEAFTKTGTEKEQGSGIGLLMCKDFIERNGGELMISSSKIGTCVSFQIPAYESTSVKLNDAG